MDAARLKRLLERFPNLTVLVAGDFFLEKYLDIDHKLSEPSLETGLEAYQVTGVRRYAGAAGTVVNNLRALGVTVLALGVVGEDGEGDDLRRALAASGVAGDSLISAAGRFTPTYLKPMLQMGGAPATELNRFDTKNRAPLEPELETQLLGWLRNLVPQVQGVVISDQVSEPNCGVITDRVRGALGELAREYPGVHFAADSRVRIGQFSDVVVKPNAGEAMRATDLADLHAAGRELYRRTHRPVVITQGDQGILAFDGVVEHQVPGIHVAGPIDVVGAGDSVMAGLVSGLCAGGTLAEAAMIGNLAASLTIQQLGVTGTATREEVMRRFEEVEGVK
jgi:rfaE bifunctional protein kinase chain/domain